MADPENGVEMVEQEEPMNVEMLYAALEKSTDAMAPGRAQAEAVLKQAEAGAKPGYVLGLLQIVRETTVKEDIRLLAAVVAKNAVGSSWRKTLGTREWARVPAEEKANVRGCVLQVLLSDPSRRLAVQLALLVTNIARFDFPSPWESLLDDLVNAAALNSPTSPEAKQRALLTLKHVVHALRFKRIVIETHAPVRGRVSPEEIGGLASRIAAERTLLNQRMQGIFRPLLAEWQAARAGAAQNLALGEIANRCLQVLRELLLLIPSWEGIENEVRQFMEAIVTASNDILNVLPGGVEEGSEGVDPFATNATKALERMAQCVVAAMDKNPLDFAPYLPTFMNLYLEAALLSVNTRMVQKARAKRRVLLVRFLTAALLSNFYSTKWATNQRERLAKVPDWGGPPDATLAAAEAAAVYIDGQLLNGVRCTQLLEQVIAKYVALSEEELNDWQTDPEDYVRSVDVESSPDADTPRPCGIKLLLAMLERGEDSVASRLLQITYGLMNQAQSPETVLLREACYRVIGEASTQPCIAAQTNITDWYGVELAALLNPNNDQAPDGTAEQLAGHVLRARATWLVGVLGGSLPPPLWGQALNQVAAGLTAPDLVLALSSVSSIIALAAGILEDKEVVRALDEQQGRDPAGNPFFDEKSPPGEQEAELRAATAARAAALEQSAGPILVALFVLLDRLTEMEGMVRVLQLVSVLVELLGDHVLPHLGIITNALPRVWSTATSAARSGREGGAAARLHSALIAVLTHLVSRVGIAAVSDQQVANILWPLLEYTTNTANVESETLLEEGIRLMQAILSACPDLPQPVQALLPRFMSLLVAGRNNRPLLLLLEAFFLLGARGFMEQYVQPAVVAIQRSIEATSDAMATAISLQKSVVEDTPVGAGDDAPGVRAMQTLKETVPEAMAAASLTITLLQLYPETAVQLLEPALRVMAQVVASEYSDGTRIPVPLSTLCEGFLEVMGRLAVRSPAALPQLLSNVTPEGQSTFMDRWIHTALTRQLEELFGPPAMAAAGRLRRHLAAAAFCALICSGAPSCLTQPGRLVRALQLCQVALNEEERLQGDRDDIQAIFNDLQAGNDPVDHVVVRRLQLSAGDPIRDLSLRDYVQAAIRAASTIVPEPQLLEVAAVSGGGVESWLRNALHPEAAVVPMA